jgi:hypothetical protein
MKVCKNKAGLTIHRKRMHERSKHKVVFTCDRCDENFSMETNLINHKKSCTGLRALDPDKKICNICDKAVSKKNFRRHCDTHDQREPSQNTVRIARVYKAASGPCPLCGQ